MSTAGVERVDFRYRYDFEQCARLGRRVGVLLSRGNLEAARESLEFAWDELSGRKRVVAGEYPVVRIPGLSIRDVNALEHYLQATFVADLCGRPLSSYEQVPNFGDKALAALRDGLNTIGLPFPLPPADRMDGALDQQIELHDELYQKGQLTMTQTQHGQQQLGSENGHLMIDLLNVKPDDLKRLDEQIRDLESQLQSLKRARKSLAAIVEGKPSTPSRRNKPGGTSRVFKAIEELGGQSNVDAVAEKTGMSAQAVRISVGKHPQIERDGDELRLVEVPA